MSQADQAAAVAEPDLGLARELPSDPHAAKATRARAAATVDAFARTQALDALDAVLAADERRSARSAAEAASATSRRLDTEVARFRALQRSV